MSLYWFCLKVGISGCMIFPCTACLFATCKRTRPIAWMLLTATWLSFILVLGTIFTQTVYEMWTSPHATR